MRIKLLLFCVVIGFCQPLVAQIKIKGDGMIPLREYTKLANTTLDKIAPEAIRIFQNDTLVDLLALDKIRKEKYITVPFDYRSPQFIELYKEVGFQDENTKDSLPARMRYWKDEIKLYFSDEVEKKDKKQLGSFVKQLAKDVDSLKINVVGDSSKANYIVYYKDHFEYEPKLNSEGDVDYYVYWSGGYLNKGFLRISKSRYFNDAERVQQLKYYFVRSLGFFKETKELGCGSYFSTCNDAAEYLTPLDLELLQYHYSYGICKGVRLNVFEELWKTAEIFKAKKNHSYGISHLKSIFEK